MKKNLLLFAGLLLVFYSCGFNGKSNEPNLKLIPYQSGEKWGYIDKNGKIVINPQFNMANVFIDGLALVSSPDGKYGYITEDGKYKINPMYKYASYFSEGLACVVLENGKPQFIDMEGNMKFTVNQGEACGVFNNGMALVLNEGKWGYIDKQGNLKINFQFDYAYPFNEGLAAVGQITKDEQEVLWGFINEKGEIIISYQFKGANKFSDGLAVVSDGKQWGYIDTKGKYIINPQFDNAGPFKNNYAVVKQGEMAGYIDKKGKIVINPQFNYALLFSDNGIAMVSSSDGKIGYINKEGKYSINSQFDGGTSFYGDIAFVASGEKWGIINKEGKYLANPQFDNINVDFEQYKLTTIYSDYFTIEMAASDYLKALMNKDYDKAKTLATKETAQNLDMMKSLGTDFGLTEVKDVKCTITGDKAVCTFCCSKDSTFKELKMKKEGDKWLADQPKESPPVTTDSLNY